MSNQRDWLDGPASWSMAEFYTVLFSVPLTIAVAIGLAAGAWDSTWRWAVAHQVLLPAHHGTVVTLPATGAGLDVPRLAITLSVILLAAAAGVHVLITSIRAARAARHDQEGQTT